MTTSDTQNNRIKIAAVTRKPDAGSFVERIANNIPGLAQAGVDVTVHVLPRSPLAIISLMSKLSAYDGIWWQRHLLQKPFQWLLRRAGRPVVFDYDDPIYLSSNPAQNTSWVRGSRFKGMIRLSSGVFCGSRFLAQAATPHCADVRIISMPVIVPPLPPARPAPRADTILYWFGSRITMPYLDYLIEPLEALGARRKDITLRVVGHGGFSLKNMKVDFVPWSRENENIGLAECDIGLCPMPSTPWAQGKCPYKVLCYMASAMPWVGSAVGENLVVAGEELPPAQARGLIARDTPGWIKAIETLADDKPLAAAMGLRCHQYALENHERSRLIQLQAKSWREIIHKFDHKTP